VPFLRVLRDKRGYETTYLMHWFRDGHRQRSRVLYVFRSPGGVRVGRSPLDRDALREIEARYPDIEFDWDAVRENQQVIEAAPEVRRRRPKREDGEAAAPPPGGTAAEAVPVSTAGVPPALPSAITGETPDEQIAFLTTWFPVVRERIASRIVDTERRDVLLALADRLNPASWTDAEQITAGLAQARDALERLSRILSRRRRRARKRPRGADRPENPASSSPS
jgi:hypothetical protein